MTNKEFETIGKALLPELPGFVVKGHLMLIPPVRQILRGICFEQSGFDKRSFYVWMFFLPLFVPRTHLSFEFGKRIGHGWTADAPDLLRELAGALKSQALPFLSPVKSACDVAQAAMSMQLPQNPHLQQAIAYSLALAGDVDNAVAELNTLLAMLDLKIQWQHEMAERGELLKAKLLANPADAKCQLEAWEAESVRNLGLDKLR